MVHLILLLKTGIKKCKMQNATTHRLDKRVRVSKAVSQEVDFVTNGRLFVLVTNHLRHQKGQVTITAAISNFCKCMLHTLFIVFCVRFNFILCYLYILSALFLPARCNSQSLYVEVSWVECDWTS